MVELKQERKGLVTPRFGGQGAGWGWDLHHMRGRVTGWSRQKVSSAFHVLKVRLLCAIQQEKSIRKWNNLILDIIKEVGGVVPSQYF